MPRDKEGYEVLTMKVQDAFYESLTPEQNALAHTNEYDLDSPKSIDFDLLVEKLKELKQGCVKVEYMSPSRRRGHATDIDITAFVTGEGQISQSTHSKSINDRRRPRPSTPLMFSY